MSKSNEMTVEVKAKVHVDDRTADACLKLVEIYMNDNRDSYIEAAKLEDGTIRYTIERRREYVRE